MYLSPEVQRIYLIRKEDIENNNIVLNIGWAIKLNDLDRYNIKENEYTEKYKKRKSLFSLVKLPMDSENTHKYESEQLKEVLLKKSLRFIQEHNLKIDGDIIGIVINVAVEDSREMQYILMSVPIADM